MLKQLINLVLGDVAVVLSVVALAVRLAGARSVLIRTGHLV